MINDGFDITLNHLRSSKKMNTQCELCEDFETVICCINGCHIGLLAERLRALSVTMGDVQAAADMLETLRQRINELEAAAPQHPDTGETTSQTVADSHAPK